MESKKKKKKKKKLKTPWDRVGIPFFEELKKGLYMMELFR